MGVRGLLSFLKQHSSKRTIADILKGPPQKIGIDISYYLYKWQGDTDRILNFIKIFQTHNHSILLVFDGRAEEGKQAESKRRKDIRSEELKTAASLQSALEMNDQLSQEQRTFLNTVVKEHEKRGWQLTREIRHAFKERLYEEKIPLLKAIGEADTLLSSLAIRKEIDLVISGDMDLLVLGTPNQYVPYDDGKSFYQFNRERVLKNLKITDIQFRSFCAMCSTEYSKDTTVPPDIRMAYHGIRTCQSLEAVKQKYPTWLETWPTAEHIFFRDISNIYNCLREDEIDRYTAFLEGKPQPYYSEKDIISISIDIEPSYSSTSTPTSACQSIPSNSVDSDMITLP